MATRSRMTDQRIIDWIADEGKNEQGIDLCQDRMARLKEAGEKAKIELSTVMQTRDQPVLHHRRRRGLKHLTMTLSRAAGEVDRRLDRVQHSLCAALEDVKLTKDIDEVVLVGGDAHAGGAVSGPSPVSGQADPHGASTR
ncbi:MAG: Hsp70 family protein [Anaerolineae bacterium]|nr:Hsp70 family protein [Anaerolineae bacterium]